MKRLSLFSCFAIVLISTVCVAGDFDDATTLRQIASYRLWTKVNSEPVTINTEPIKLAPTLPKVSLAEQALREAPI